MNLVSGVVETTPETYTYASDWIHEEHPGEITVCNMYMKIWTSAAQQGGISRF
jgi:hypothetical protein